MNNKISVQYNGQLVGSIDTNSTMTTQEIENMAIQHLSIADQLNGLSVTRFIHVPEKLINVIGA
jgi:leucyl-tRNA synthetase